MSKKKLLEVKNLKQHFPIDRKSVVKAVDGITFDIYEGETFGLVGESGSGKSTTGRTIIRLYNPTDGEIIFDGKDISGKMNKNTKKFLNKNMQMIFQDPMACLNPRMTVMDIIADIIAEGLDIHKMYKTKDERTKKVYELLKTVGLNEQHASRYPHEFSGGQRQRIGIARSLAIEPKFIIADEPISALDVSIQAQVVNLFRKLQKENGLTYLFIAHDLSMVKYISDRIGVMHNGKLVELANSDDLYIADEPISALDVSIQAQVVNLLRKLQKENGLTYLFIAHDLSMVKYISDRIGVMHNGKLVELANSDDLYSKPLHPYTKSLLSAIPLPDPDHEKTRVRIKYDSNCHDYSTHKPKWVEIRPGHFIYGSEPELEEYEKEISSREYSTL